MGRGKKGKKRNKSGKRKGMSASWMAHIRTLRGKNKRKKSGNYKRYKRSKVVDAL